MSLQIKKFADFWFEIVISGGFKVFRNKSINSKILTWNFTSHKYFKFFVVCGKICDFQKKGKQPI